MFLRSTDVAVVITGVVFRTKDDREKDNSKTIEIACQVPLTCELAGFALEHPDLSKELYAQNEKTGEWFPKADLKEAAYNVSARKLLIVKLATSPGGTRPKLTLDGATVKAVSVAKSEANEWDLFFRLAAPLVASKDAVPFIDALKETVFLTFEEKNPGLDYDTAAPTTEGSVATVNEGGVVESVAPAHKPKKAKAPKLVKRSGKDAASGDDQEDPEAEEPATVQ